MNSNRSFRRLLAVLGLLLVQAGNAVTAADDAVVSPVVEKTDSRQAQVTRVQARAEDARHLRVSGQLKKRFSRRGPVYGRLLVSLLDAGGREMQRELVPYSRRGHDNGKAWFSHAFEVPVARVAKVEVTHLGIAD